MRSESDLATSSSSPASTAIFNGFGVISDTIGLSSGQRRAVVAHRCGSELVLGLSLTRCQLCEPSHGFVPESDCVACDTNLPQSFDLGNAAVESLNELAQRGHNARAIGRVELLREMQGGSRLT